MNADQLLAHYERIADATDAIVRLRRFLLNLAVRGKLVEQDPSDEPASELLGRAVAAKQNLMEERKIRRDSPPEHSESAGEQYSSGHWCWAYLHDFALILGGKRLPAGTSFSNHRTENIYIRVTDMKNGTISDSGLKFISDEVKAQIAKYTIKREDLYVTIAGTIGAVGDVPDMFDGHNLTENAAKVVFREIDRTFLKLVLQSADVQEQFSEKTKQMAQPKLALKRISGARIPIPPLAEQHRIVVKVDELMALCDQLEAARAEREATRDRLAAASLARLNAPDPDPAAFQNHAAFALNNLAPLTTRPDQIKQLRQTILNLAVRGKLVEQDPSDEPASELLGRAVAAKQNLMEERKIRRDSPPEHSESAGEQYSSGHWCWAYLHDFALILGGKRLPAGTSFSNHRTENIYIRVTDMKNGTISDSGLKFISDEVKAQIAKYTIKREDLYVTIAGTIGAVGDVPDMFDGHNLTENAAKVVFREIDRTFLKLVLQSADVQEQFSEKTKQMAQPKLALKRISGARIPIPPLAEQHRIVVKVDALMALCNRLEASLTTTDTTRQRLLEALLHEALTPGDDQEAAA